MSALNPTTPKEIFGSSLSSHVRMATAAFACSMLAVVAAAQPVEPPAPTADAPEAVEAIETTEPPDALPAAATPVESDEVDNTISTLRSLSSLQRDLMADIATLNQRITAAQSTGEKQALLAQLEKLDRDLKTTTQNLQEIAAGADITALREQSEPEFDFQRELFSLLQPAMKEMKDMTSHVRQKAQLRDKIAYHANKLPTTERAVSNIESLLADTDDPVLTETLQEMLAAWQKQLTFLQSESQSAQLQLRKLESSEVSLTEASQSYLKEFFRKRGLYLGQAFLVVVAILVLSRLSYAAMQRWIPGHRVARRSFRIRLLDLSHRIATSLLLIAGPMVVFYVSEDWLLFSLGILLLLGIALTVRHALPRYWQQIQLYLNVGTVREGERVELGGMPWSVKEINFYTMLENPVAKLHKRVKIDDLVDLRSRPVTQHEPWFPCERGDWVLTGDGSRGKVIGVSPELVQLVSRGGAQRTFFTADFLGQAPINLSTNFRIRETIGVSYSLQVESVSTILEQLHSHVERRNAEEGYGDHLLNMRVEFEKANTSSLDITVLADYSGDVAEIYNRLRRAIQRWCVEACTEHGWEIPFTQVTIHDAR